MKMNGSYIQLIIAYRGRAKSPPDQSIYSRKNRFSIQAYSQFSHFCSVKLHSNDCIAEYEFSFNCMTIHG